MVTILVFSSLILIRAQAIQPIYPRITNGVDTIREQYPFVASIQTGLPLVKKFTHSCGAVVYNRHWILTVAQCIHKLLYGTLIARVVVGMFFTNIIDKHAQVHQIVDKFVHENYSRSDDIPVNNIGLINVEPAISIKDHMKLAKFLLGSNIREGEALILGWGKTSPGFLGKTPKVLQKGSFRLLPVDQCDPLLIAFKISALLINRTQICSQSSGRDVSPCKGDFGSPLILNTSDGLKVIGLLSWTITPCGTEGAPTISTDISHYRTWIEEKIPEY